MLLDKVYCQTTALKVGKIYKSSEEKDITAVLMKLTRSTSCINGKMNQAAFEFTIKQFYFP